MYNYNDESANRQQQPIRSGLEGMRAGQQAATSDEAMPPKYQALVKTVGEQRLLRNELIALHDDLCSETPREEGDKIEEIEITNLKDAIDYVPDRLNSIISETSKLFLK